MKSDRSSKPRGKPGTGPARGAPRKPARAFGESGPRRPSSSSFGAPARARPARPAGPPRERGTGTDPYQPARRPARDFSARGEGSARFARGERSPRFAERTGSAERGGGRGFTVTLDPDVARVFRGDASVNRALRLVLQMMQVVQGPPASRGDRAPRGYQGTPEARGFTRKPRFDEDDENLAPSEEISE